MNQKYIYFALAMCLVTISLYAPIKSNLSGTTYSRIQDDRTKILQPRKPWISVYGSQRAEPRTDVIALYFQYTLPLELLDVSNLNGNSTLTQGSAMMKLEASADTTVTSTISSKKSVNYSPGHEIMTMFTAMFPTAGASSSGGAYYDRYIGMFNATNGFGIGERKGTFGIQYLKNGTSTFIPQTSFNLDQLDGTGQSGMIIDWSKLNIFYISFGWLGAAPIEFGVADEGGNWVTFHHIRYPNLQTSPSIHNPSLPIAMSVSKSNSDTGLLSIQTASWDATITGHEQAIRTHTTTRNTVTVDGNTLVPILTLRNRTTFVGKASTARMRILFLNFAAQDTTNKLIRVQLLKEATLDSTNYSNINDLHSIAEVDTSATSFSETGTLIFQASTQNGSELWLKSNGLNVELYPGETLSIGAAEEGTGTATTDFSITWEEFL